jgi:threonine/homoserine/homoserine lactone efflux protein
MTVEHIFTRPPAGGPQAEHSSVGVLAGAGIQGDRYFDKHDEPGQNLTLVEAEEIESFLAEHGRAPDLSVTGRNLVTRGVRLNDLLNREFMVGEVRCRGVELCEPCLGWAPGSHRPGCRPRRWSSASCTARGCGPMCCRAAPSRAARRSPRSPDFLFRSLSSMITIDFLITSLIVVLIPGTGVVFTVSTGLALGKRATVYAALGCTAGIVPHLLATVLGLAAVLHMSAVAFQALKFAGVAYLLYLAYATWQDRQAFALDKPPGVTSGRGIAVKAFLLNILNPKLSIFFLAFLPQFVAHDAASPLPQLLLLSGVFMAMTFVVFMVYGLMANGFRKAVVDSPRVQAWLRRSFSATFAALGVNLAFSER